MENKTITNLEIYVENNALCVWCYKMYFTKGIGILFWGIISLVRQGNEFKQNNQISQP